MVKDDRGQKPQSVGQILSRFNPLEDKYISREFQAYGIYLAEQLNDAHKKALYIKLARDVPRSVLEKALSFVKEAGYVRSRARLFMWKLSELMGWKQKHNSQNSKKKLKLSKL